MSPARPTPALLAVLLAAALGGCAVGPDYVRPESATNLPAQFAPGSAKLAYSPSVASTWWTLFGDRQLDALVGKALANSPDARSAAARVEEADAVIRQVDAALLPQVDATAAGTHSRISQTTATPLPSSVAAVRNNARLALTTSFELDVWGKLRRASEAARAQALGSRYGRDTVALSIAGLVTQGYLNLRALDAQRLVTAESVASAERSLKLTQVRFDGGIASQLDVQQADSALATLQAALLQLDQAREQAENLLGYLVGEPGLKIAAGDLRDLPIPPVPPAGLPSSLLEARPDVRQAETDLIAANAKIGVAKAALFPGITLTGNFGRESKDLSQLFTSPSSVWALGAGITQPIFEGGRLRAQVDQVAAQQKQVAEAYRKAVYTAFKETNDALASLRVGADAEDTLTRALNAAKRNLMLAQARYDGGYSPYLEVLTAQRSANDAALAWIQNRQARLAASVDLFRALGGGWQDSQKLAANP